MWDSKGRVCVPMFKMSFPPQALHWKKVSPVRCTTYTYTHMYTYICTTISCPDLRQSLLLSTSWLSVPRVLIRQSSAPRYFQGVRFYQETFCQRELSESHLNAHHFFRVVLVSWSPHLHLQELQLPLEILGVLLKKLAKVWLSREEFISKDWSFTKA